ncbi:MAG: FkbM family methyltransferase [Bacteroidota bacterium]
MRQTFYQPQVNRLARQLIAPFKTLVPESLHFPVSGAFEVLLPEQRTVRLTANPTSYVAKTLYWKGFDGFERDQASLFIRLAKEADVILDIGANIGYYSLLAALYNPEAQVHCFEPIPEIVSYIEKNLALNRVGSVHVHPIALSSTAGETDFYVSVNPKYAWCDAQLSGRGSMDAVQAGQAAPPRAIRVRTQKLDDFKSLHLDARVDLIKLDVEASEHIVLRGSTHVLREDRPLVFCEVLPGRIENELDALFTDAGYRFYRLESSLAVPVRSLSESFDGSNDHLMVPKERVGYIERHLPTG